MAYKIVFKDIAKYWQEATLTPLENIIAFSPYITSPIAEIVLQSNPHCSCTFYTLFNAEIFINKSSSLSTLKKILTNGYKIYSLKNLHAKIVVSDNDFATIGSQNITQNGTLNKEANVVFTDKQSVSKIIHEIKDWITDRIEITLEMINEMEMLVEPYIKEYDLILKKVNHEEKDIFEAQKERNKAIELLKLKTKIDNLLKSNENIYCKVNAISKYSEYHQKNYTRFSLMPTNKNKHLTAWHINGKNYNLTNTFRYICLNLTTGTFGWARVVKTRITFFESNVSLGEPLELDGIKYKVNFTAILNDSNRNIEIKISPFYSPKSFSVIFGGKFDLFCLNEIKMIKEITNNPETISSFSNWVKNNTEEFANIISKKLLNPFKYKNNLTGVEANKFFGNWKGNITLQLVDVKGYKILVTETL